MLHMNDIDRILCQGEGYEEQLRIFVESNERYLAQRIRASKLWLSPDFEVPVITEQPYEPIQPLMKLAKPARGDPVYEGGRVGYILYIDWREREVAVKFDSIESYSLDDFQDNYTSKGGRTKWQFG